MGLRLRAAFVVCVAVLLNFTTCDAQQVMHIITDAGLGDGKDVRTLSEDTLDAFLRQKSASIVLFYAPWCPYSRIMLPHFHNAAGILAHQLRDLHFGKIDGTLNLKVVGKHGIRGYPTLLMDMDGVKYEYSGGHTHIEILSWIAEILETEVSIVSPDHLRTVMDVHKDEPVVIASFDPSTKHSTNGQGQVKLANEQTKGSAEDIFIRLSRKFKGMFFVDTSEKEVIEVLVKDYGLPADLKQPFFSILMPTEGELKKTSSPELFEKYHNTDPSLIPFAGNFTDINATSTFVRTYQFPLVTPFHSTVIEKLFSDGRPIFCLFVEQSNREQAKASISALHNAAKRFRSQMIFVVSYQDEIFDLRLKATLGATEAHSTFRIFTVNPNGNKTWSPLLKYKPSDELRQSMDEAGIQDFVEKYFSKKLLPHLESEPIPEVSEQHGYVKELVGLNFVPEVLESDKDVFVTFSASWCGHCRKLRPTLNDIATRLRHHKGIVVANIDASRNEIPGLTIHAYPELLLFPQGRKKNPVSYHSERTTKSLLLWMSQQCHHKFDLEQVMNETVEDDDGLLDFENVHDPGAMERTRIEL